MKTSQTLTCLLIVFTTFYSRSSFAQKIIQDRASLTAYLKDDDGRGVGSATASLDYAVKRMGDEVLFSLSYSQVVINPEAGYYYKGKRYASEVPGLIELLRSTRGSYPKVNFDIYYGPHKEGSFTHQISARNDLGTISGDFRTFKTTKDKLDNPQWRLVATSLTGFNYSPDPTTWMAIESLITNYERDKQEKEKYDNLVKEGDQLFNSNQYKDALVKYMLASKFPMADQRLKSQITKTKELMEKGDKEQNYQQTMETAREAENKKDYRTALSLYTAAAKLGVNNYEAEASARRMNTTLDDLKRKQEDDLKKKQAEEAKQLKDIEDQKIRDKEETERLSKIREETIRKKNEEEEEKMKEALAKEEKARLEKQLEEKLEAERQARKEQEEAEERKEKKERKDRRSRDEKMISAYEDNMEFDPILYDHFLTLAETHFRKANNMKPYEALELKNEWWDMNIYMEDFRDDLNEPRRQEAWQKSQQLLYQQEGEYEQAKYYYMKAIQYTDRNSRQHKYLLGKVEWMNKDIDFQKVMLKASREGEEMRKQNYENAKAFKYVNRIAGNREKAALTYHILTQDYRYPTLNSNVKGSENALQRQMDFERRLNEADQQLRQDNLITGVTSQLAMGAMIDDSKTTEVYGNHSMGINLFALTGYAGYPVVANENPMPGYITRTRLDQMSVSPFQGGFDWWIHRSNNWDIGLTGDVIVGVLPMLGYKNTFFSYGGNFKVNAGVKRIKLALEADWHHRNGSYEYDQDVAMAALNNPWQQPTEVIFSGSFNYSNIKAGAGLHLNFADEYSDGYMRLMYYAEKPSFYTNFSKEKAVKSAGLQVVFRGGITLWLEYAKNYVAAGTAENIMSSYTDKDYYKISFGKTWTIGKTK